MAFEGYKFFNPEDFRHRTLIVADKNMSSQKIFFWYQLIRQRCLMPLRIYYEYVELWKDFYRGLIFAAKYYSAIIRRLMRSVTDTRRETFAENKDKFLGNFF